MTKARDLIDNLKDNVPSTSSTRRSPSVVLFDGKVAPVE